MSDLEPRLTYRTVKLALLSAALESGDGRPLLTRVLEGRAEDPFERGMAEDALRQLLDAGLIRLSKTGAAGLTEAGRSAHGSGCLDALDRKLHDLDSDLVACRARAWEAVASGGPREREAAIEAIARILDGISASALVLSPVARKAMELARGIAEGADPPSSQDVADAIRVTEIVVRAARPGD